MFALLNKKVLITAAIAIIMGLFPALLIHQLILEPKHAVAYQYHHQQEADLRAIKISIAALQREIEQQKRLQATVNHWHEYEQFTHGLMEALWVSRPESIHLKTLNCQMLDCQLVLTMPSLKHLAGLQQWLHKDLSQQNLRMGQIQQVPNQVEVQFMIGNSHEN